MNYTLKIKRADSHTQLMTFDKITYISIEDPSWEEYFFGMPTWAGPQEDDHVFIEGIQPNKNDVNITYQYFLKLGDVAYIISNESGKTVDIIRT